MSISTDAASKASNKTSKPPSILSQESQDPRTGAYRSVVFTKSFRVLTTDELLDKFAPPQWRSWTQVAQPDIIRSHSAVSTCQKPVCTKMSFNGWPVTSVDIRETTHLPNLPTNTRGPKTTNKCLLQDAFLTPTSSITSFNLLYNACGRQSDDSSAHHLRRPN